MSFPFMMDSYVVQRKESFIGELVKCGISILTNQKSSNEVFNCFGIHSLFDTVAKLSELLESIDRKVFNGAMVVSLSLSLASWM